MREIMIFFTIRSLLKVRTIYSLIYSTYFPKMMLKDSVGGLLLLVCPFSRFVNGNVLKLAIIRAARLCGATCTILLLSTHTALQAFTPFFIYKHTFVRLPAVQAYIPSWFRPTPPPCS